ncbi:hypothetical protein AB0N21_30095, partial [Streptomyces sp. NPDC051080]|uniref:hypothetical protein n=1 Tax=Streptomyces sp. NPDC051080 TaxID=3157222 RepID=UPI0034303FAC
MECVPHPGTVPSAAGAAGTTERAARRDCRAARGVLKKIAQEQKKKKKKQKRIRKIKLKKW